MRLDTGQSKLSHISPEILAEVVVRLEEVDLQDKQLTPRQLQSIFIKMTSSENLALTSLNISRNDLSSVPADVLVRAISRQVDLVHSNLTPHQVQTIFDHIASCEELRVYSLEISHNNLSSVCGEVVARAVSRLWRADLGNTRLTPAQLHQVFTLLAERRSPTLKIVCLDGNNVQSVPGDLRERAQQNCPVLRFDRDHQPRVAKNHCCLGVQ